MSKRLFLMVLVLVILCSCAVAPQTLYKRDKPLVTSQNGWRLNSQVLPNLYKYNAPIVVSVYTLIDRYASGFVIDSKNGFILTAAHLVRQRKSLSIGFISGDTTSGKVIAVDYENDLALIKVDSNSFNFLLRSDAQLNINPAVGESIFVIGNPGKFERTISSGILSTNISYANYYWTSFPLGFYLSDLHIFEGSSGCPIFDLNSKVIGMIVGYDHNYSVIVPATSIEKFLNKYVYANNEL